MDKKIVGLTIGLICIGILVGALTFNVFPFHYRNAELNIDVGTYSLHVTTWVQRVGDAEPLFWSHHAGVLTTIGKNEIEGELGDSAHTDHAADDISLSCDATAPSAAWTQIPVEITTGGLERASSTYASTGDGVWTISHQFTASATHTNVQLTGLNWLITPLTNNLLGADTFTPVTLNSGDKLTVTWTITVT